MFDLTIANRLAGKLTKGHSDRADDIVQDAFIISAKYERLSTGRAIRWAWRRICKDEGRRYHLQIEDYNVQTTLDHRLDLPTILTDRQRDVCELLASGESASDVADDMNVSRQYVSRLVSEIRSILVFDSDFGFDHVVRQLNSK